MLPSQRDLFDIPRAVCYLNAASWSPLPLAVRDAGLLGVGRKLRPWEVDPGQPAAQYARARAAAAALIGTDAADIALIPSVSYGIATAARLLPAPAGTRVLLLEDDHSSPVLEWLGRAAAQGCTVETVPRPADADWTAAVLAAIDRPGAPPVSVASISSVHWADGGVLDLGWIGVALRAQGGALLVDATHGAGVMPLDVQALGVDALVFPTYKWVLGPYGRAFLYLARQHQGGIPLEQTAAARRAVDAETAPYLADLGYAAGAQRFDMGERDHFIGLEMASVGMELMAEWGAAAITGRLRSLTDRLAAGLIEAGMLVRLPPAALRAPHLLSLEFPEGMPPGLVERLAEAGVHVARRLGRMRISPHVYNDEADVDRFLAAFHDAMAESVG